MLVLSPTVVAYCRWRGEIQKLKAQKDPMAHLMGTLSQELHFWDVVSWKLLPISWRRRVIWLRNTSVFNKNEQSKVRRLSFSVNRGLDEMMHFKKSTQLCIAVKSCADPAALHGPIQNKDLSWTLGWVESFASFDSSKTEFYFWLQNHLMGGKPCKPEMFFTHFHDKVHKGLHGKYSANRWLSCSHFSDCG